MLITKKKETMISFVLIAILVKVGVTGFLFFNYPDPAQLAAIVADRMMNLVNVARTEAQVPALTINNNLIQGALAKGNDMLDKQYFSQ